MAHDHDHHGADHAGAAHGAHSVRPTASGPLAYPGALAWLAGIVTGVGFIGLLYGSAGHHDAGHAPAAEGAAPAAEGAAAPAAPAH
jgi:hypothetical protein